MTPEEFFDKKLFDGEPSVGNGSDVNKWADWYYYVRDKVERLRADLSGARATIENERERADRYEEAVKGMEAALKLRKGHTVFDPGEKVILKEMGFEATIIEVGISRGGVEYFATYWSNGIRHETRVFDYELEGEPALGITSEGSCDE